MRTQHRKTIYIVELSSSELLCCTCIYQYASHRVDIPRTASTIYDGKALCWVHYASYTSINDLLEIDVDDLVRPTGYSVLRKPVKERKENEKKEKK